MTKEVGLAGGSWSALPNTIGDRINQGENRHNREKQCGTGLPIHTATTLLDSRDRCQPRASRYPSRYLRSTVERSVERPIGLVWKQEHSRRRGLPPVRE